MEERPLRDPTIQSSIEVPAVAANPSGFDLNTDNIGFSSVSGRGASSDVLTHHVIPSRLYQSPKPAPDQLRPPHLFSRRARAGMSVLALAGAGSFVAFGFGSTPTSGAQAKDRGAAVAKPTAEDVNYILNTPVLTETQAQLASGGYNCGHTLGDGESYQNQIDYLNSNETLANNIMNFQISDPTFGMGEAAWNVITSEAIVNNATPASVVSVASTESNLYSHFVTPVTLESPQDFLNFTCDDVPNTVTPVDLIKVTQQVNGIMFTQKGLADFEAVVDKYPDGQMKFVVIPVGMQNVTDPTTGVATMQEVSVVVTEAGGCNNPLRAIPSKLPVPKPTTTTSSSSSTTTIHRFPGTTYVHPTTTTTYYRKVDNYPDPPGPNQDDPNTTVPAVVGQGTPDNGETNPVGGTEPPTTQGTSTSPTTTETVPQDTTTVPPTTTPTQPGF